jgi:hypothetical protein
MAETAIETKFPVFGKNSQKTSYSNPGNPFVYTLQFETAFDLDQAADTLSTDNLKIPGTGYFVIEGMTAKVSEAFAFTTAVPTIGLVEAGGTPSTSAIAVHTFATTQAVGDCATGTYSAALTPASPKLKIKAGTAYELGIVVRPTGGIVTGQIKELHLLLRPVSSFAA